MTAVLVAPESAPRVDDLFGAGVLAETAPVEPYADDLWPEERVLVAKAVASRRHEFAAGRRLARRLLARLGLPPAAIGRQPDRAPIWPEGVVGSLSHCRELALAAVARRGTVWGVGADVEPDSRLEPALWKRICTARELSRLAAAPVAERGRLARLVFSAKESTYKCVHPVTRILLGFHDVEIDWEPERQRFRPRLLREDVRALLPRRAIVEGAFAVRGGFLLTSATGSTDAAAGES